MKIHLAADHAGYRLKETIKKHLLGQGYEVQDHGAFAFNSEDDFPDFIIPCARSVAADPESRGLIFGGSGQGEAMAANRVKGIRAAVYYGGTEEIVLLSRRHNNANVLSLGARFVTEEEALKVIVLWLKEAFEHGRHDRRIRALDQ
ncbi:MAG: RpiB/LacA/LacB family sugar-phosphate isomerase [Fidelibacterota bacterium]